jgi:hypothetical protein
MPTDRRTGKTVAVILRALMVNPKKVRRDVRALLLENIMRGDPDYKKDDPKRREIYRREYDSLSHRCLAAGIPVLDTALVTRSGSWICK